MRKPSFSLQMENQCSEAWDSMTPNEQGRYCASCEKTVIDFASMSDTELISFFANYKKGTKICGRITKSQLERSFPKAKAATLAGSSWRRAAAAVLLLASLAQPLTANAHAWMPANTVLRQENPNHKNEKLDNSGEETRLLNGFVESAEGERMPFAAISIVQGKKATLLANADDKGFFSIEIDQKLWKKGFKVVATAVGHENGELQFEPKSRKLRANNPTDFVIKLQGFSPVMYLGGLGFVD